LRYFVCMDVELACLEDDISTTTEEKSRQKLSYQRAGILHALVGYSGSKSRASWHCQIARGTINTSTKPRKSSTKTPLMLTVPLNTFLQQARSLPRPPNSAFSLAMWATVQTRRLWYAASTLQLCCYLSDCVSQYPGVPKPKPKPQPKPIEQTKWASRTCEYLGFLNRRIGYRLRA
jgi:hypothetical protein